MTADGTVENRVIDVPVGMPQSSLVEATNFLTARLIGKTLDEARSKIERELQAHRADLNGLTKGLVEAGLATWTGEDDARALIVAARKGCWKTCTLSRTWNACGACSAPCRRRRAWLPCSM